MSAITVGDGTVGFEDWGPPDGRPVLSFHGGLHSRYFRHPDPVAGVRLITVDRPGYGLTSPGSLADWPRTVITLLDHLGVERVGLVAHSAGGRFALACASAEPARFPRAVLAAPEPEQTTLDGHPLGPLFAMIVNDPDGSRAVVEDMVAAGLTDLDATVERHVSQYGLRAVEADPALRTMYRQSLREAVRQGAAGVWGDSVASTQPWPFDLSAVSVPVTLYAGRTDRLVTLEMVEKMAATLAHGAEVVVVDAGHDVPLVVWAEMLTGAAAY